MSASAARAERGPLAVKGAEAGPLGPASVFPSAKGKPVLQRHRCGNLRVQRIFLPGDIDDGGALLRHGQHREFENVLGVGGIGGCGVVVGEDVLVAHVLPQAVSGSCSFSTVARRSAVSGFWGCARGSVIGGRRRCSYRQPLYRFSCSQV